jgi:hypothetical protein
MRNLIILFTTANLLSFQAFADIVNAIEKNIRMRNDFEELVDLRDASFVAFGVEPGKMLSSRVEALLQFYEEKPKEIRKRVNDNYVRTVVPSVSESGCADGKSCFQETFGFRKPFVPTAPVKATVLIGGSNDLNGTSQVCLGRTGNKPICRMVWDGALKEIALDSGVGLSGNLTVSRVADSTIKQLQLSVNFEYESFSYDGDNVVQTCVLALTHQRRMECEWSRKSSTAEFVVVKYLNNNESEYQDFYIKGRYTYPRQLPFDILDFFMMLATLFALAISGGNIAVAAMLLAMVYPVLNAVAIVLRCCFGSRRKYQTVKDQESEKVALESA